MRKILILCLAMFVCLSVEAADELKISRISDNDTLAAGTDFDISTDNSTSRLVSIILSVDHPSSEYTSVVDLDVFDGTTEKINLATDHETVTWSVDKDVAPVFSTDIAANLYTDGYASATFVYIEME